MNDIRPELIRMLEAAIAAASAKCNDLGAPGDYGYDTPAGEALFALYRADAAMRDVLVLLKKGGGDDAL